MNLVQFILLIGILFYADTINGQIANTTALDPYLHYINVTIRYHVPYIADLYPMDNIILLPQYGIVLASCYLNISREEVNSTFYNTDPFVVEITNFNISIFYSTFRTVTEISHADDSGDTMVKFEFYLSQNGTFILATHAIEVFNNNCNTSDWKDSFTSDSISASAIFSSKQTSLISSSSISSSIYTSSFQYIPSISSVASVVSSHFFTTEQVSTPAITSPTLPSSAIELSTTPLSVETTSIYSTYVQTQVIPSVASRTVPSISQSAVPTSLAHTTGSVGVSFQSSLTAPTTTSQYVTSESKSVFQSTTNTTTGIAITQSDKAITSTPFPAPSSSITNVMHTPFLPVLSSSQPVLSQSAVPPHSSRIAIQSTTATQPVTADSKSVFKSTLFLAASSSIPNVIRVSSQIHTSSFLPVLSSSQPAIPSHSASSVHGPLQVITSSAVIQVPSQSQQTSNRTIQYSASSSSNASTPTLTLNTSAVSTSMSLFVGSRIIVDLPSTGILGSLLSSPVQSPITSIVSLPSSSIYSTRHIVQPPATSTRPLVPVSSQMQSVVSLQSSTAIIQQPSFSTSSIRQPIIPSSSIRQPIIPSSSIRQPIIPVSSSIRQPIIPSSSIRQPIIPSSSSIRQPIIPSSSIRQPIIPVSSSIRQPIIPSSSIRQPIIPVSSSIRQPIIPSSSSIRQAIIPSSSSIRQPIIPSSSSIRQPIIPSSSSIRQPIVPSSSSIRQPIIPVSSSIRQPIIPSSSIQQPIILSSSTIIQQPIIPSSSSIRQPIIPVSSSIQQPIIPSSSSIQQPIIPSSSISSAINFRLLSSSMVPLSTSFIRAQSSSFSPDAIYQPTSLLSAVRSLTSAVSRMLTQTGILPASSSVQAPFYNTSTQFVVPTHSVPQQPSAVFNSSQLSSTMSTSQLLSTHSINTSTLIDRVQSLTTQPPIQSTVLPSASSVQPTPIPQVSPYRHYLIAKIEYTLSSFEIGQTDDNINSTITAIASRYLNITTQTAIAMYTLTTEHISVRVGNLTVTAIRSEYDQSLIENIATRRVVFYVTNNTAILLATHAKTVLDTYSIDQWAESTGLQTSSVAFDLYGQTGSTLIATMAVSSQLPSSIPILNTTVIPMTSLTPRPVLSTSTELNRSLIVSSLQPVTSSSIRVSHISSTRHTMLTSLSGQIQQPLPSSSIQSPILATQSISTPVQLMTSSLRDTLITLSSNRSALPIPATAESPVISITSSLISVLNSTLSSQPLVSSIFPTTQAVQPSLAVMSSGISSVQLRPNTTSLAAMARVNSTQFPTSTGFLNASARMMTSSPNISRIPTRTSVISMIRNTSLSQIESLSSRMNTSSLFPTQRVSISQNSSLQQMQSVPLSSTPIPDYQTLTDFNPGDGYLLQLTLNASGTKVNLSREFYISTELKLINLYSLGLRIAEPSVNNRRKRDVFNTTSQIACGIIDSLTISANNRLIIVFYISREENGLPLTFVPADTSIYVFDKLEPFNFTVALGYEFLSLSIYEGIFVDPHRLAIIVGTILGCCSLVMLIFLVILCLYHCLHSDYIRADKWSPNMSITYSNKGVYTGSTSKLMNEDEFEMEFTGTTFSEGTQTLARDFLSGSSQITRNSADYAFTLRTEPNLFSPFQVEESFSPIPEATTRSADQTETDKYPPASDTGPAPTVSQLRSEIEEEKRRAKRAEASLLEIMTANRRHLAETPVFSDASEAKRAEERASAVYEKSKKELAVVTAAVTPSSSYGSSLSSSRGTHRPWSSRGSKVAPSNEPYDGLTPEPKILDWVPEHDSVSSKSSRSMQLSGYRNVRTPNIMQVEPRPILETPPPAYDQSPVETQAKPIPVRVFRTDGHPVQMHPTVPSTPVTTSTINVLPSFNPFYTTAKKEHTSL